MYVLCRDVFRLVWFRTRYVVRWCHLIYQAYKTTDSIIVFTKIKVEASTGHWTHHASVES